jgi:predicted transcriptional regulator
LDGLIKVLPGDLIGFDTDIEEDGLNLVGNESVPFTGSEQIVIKDLDGDQSEDLIIGIPGNDGGRGRLMIRYSNQSSNLTGNLSFGPDAIFTGEDPGDGLGKAIIILEDHNGDLLPDIFLGVGDGLRQLDMPQNIIPFEIQNIEFQREGGSKEIKTAEQGDTVRIVCEAAGGDLTEPDIIKARVSTLREEGPTESWIHLRENGRSSGIFTGRLMLSSASVPGRSIGVVNNDVVGVSVLGNNGSRIQILGFQDQEDPPYFVKGNTTIKIMEDSTLNELLIFADPDGDPLQFSHSGVPGWVGLTGPFFSGGFYEYRIFGTPDNGFVGWNNFTITASSRGTNTTVDVSIYVTNRIPMIEALEVPEGVKEGSDYRAVFDLKEEGGTISAMIMSNGNATWINISGDGIVSGIPQNRHVGPWTFNLTLDDGNGGIDWYAWDVLVGNAPPNLIMPDIENCTEKVPLTLDFDSEYEGDGLTAYMITLSTRENSVLNSDGVLELIPDITDSDTIGIDVWVEDGNGASANDSMEIEIMNSPAVLLNPDILPERLIAGTEYSFDLQADEEGEIWDSIPRFFYLFESNPLTGPEGIRNTNGEISIRPWNMDAGNHSLSIELQDWDNPSPFVYEWNFTVLTDASFRDPWVNVEIKGKRGSKLVVEIDHGGDLHVDTIGSFVTNSTSLIGTGTKQDPEEGDTLEVDFSMFGDVVMVVGYIIVNNTQDGTRRLNHTLEVDLDNVKKLEKDGEFPFFTLIMVFFTILIVIILILSLFIERTSFPLQLALFRGGEVREEEVLSRIQDNPGIGFADLLRSSGVPRGDLIATIDHLEKKGMARAVVDGLGVKFLPMMGAFVDGPLALNRYQRKILDILYKAGKLKASEISEASGYSRKKVDRELRMLELKGSVSGKSTSEGKEYQLTGKQKIRMRRPI